MRRAARVVAGEGAAFVRRLFADDDGEGAGPEGVGEFARVVVQVADGLGLGHGGDEDGHRLGGVALLDGVDAFDRFAVVCAGAEAVDGVGREGDDAALRSA